MTKTENLHRKEGIVKIEYCMKNKAAVSPLNKLKQKTHEITINGWFNFKINHTIVVTFVKTFELEHRITVAIKIIQVFVKRLIKDSLFVLFYDPL